MLTLLDLVLHLHIKYMYLCVMVVNMIHTEYHYQCKLYHIYAKKYTHLISVRIMFMSG